MYQEIYKAVAEYAAIVAGSAMIFMTMLVPIATKLVQYINDGTYAHVPKWWVPLSRFVFPYKWIEDDKYYGVSPKYDYDDTDTPSPASWDGEEMFVSMLNAISWAAVILLWPLVIVCLSLWGALYLLRAVTRLTKKVVKLAQFAHKHPKDVEHTMVGD
jgi:hypothetical protein